MIPYQNRDEYERLYGTYRQPRHFLRKALARLIPLFPGFRMRASLYRLLGCRLGERVFVGLGAHLDDVFPELVSIGDDSVISLRAVILAHDDAARRVAGVSLGRKVFIGASAIVLPGVEIGDNAVVGAGAVVTRDVPAGAKVAGVPARRLRDYGNNKDSR